MKKHSTEVEYNLERSTLSGKSDNKTASTVSLNNKRRQIQIFLLDHHHQLSKISESLQLSHKKVKFIIISKRESQVIIKSTLLQFQGLTLMTIFIKVRIKRGYSSLQMIRCLLIQIAFIKRRRK